MPNSKRPVNRARRRFVQAGAITAGGLLFAACGQQDSDKIHAQAGTDASENPPTEDQPEGDNKSDLVFGALLCGGRQVNQETGDERFIFTQLSIDQTIKDKGAKQTLNTDIGFLAHGVIKNPDVAHKVLAFEKKGPGGCEIDLKTNEIVTRIKPGKGHEFYGHGAYSVDGKTVYATEYDALTYEGKMTVRDAADFSIQGEFPTHGEWPHDCQFIDDGKVVAITNGGGHIKGGSKPNVSYVDVATGDLIEKIEFDDIMINAGHLMISDTGDLAVAHAMREGLDTKDALGALSLRPDEGKFKTMVSPAAVTGAMRGETLSLCMHEEKKVVCATNPYGKSQRKGLVTFWSYEKQEYVSKLELEMPRGVALTLDKSYWVITFGKNNPGVILVSTETNEPDEKPIVFAASSQGSHVYIHDWYAKG